MRKVLLIAVMIAAMAMAVGCSSGTNSSDPKAVAFAIAKTWANNDWEDMYDYLSPKGQKFVDEDIAAMQGLLAMAGGKDENNEATKEGYLKSRFCKLMGYEVVDIAVVKTALQGDTFIACTLAQVKNTKSGELKEQAGSIVLKQEEGKWVIAHPNLGGNVFAGCKI